MHFTQMKQGLALIGLCSLGAAAFARQGVEPKRYTKEQFRVLAQKFREMNQPFYRMNLRTRRTKSLSNEDLAKIKEIQTANLDMPTKMANILKSEARLTLLYVTPATLKPGQEATIIEIVKPILEADDLKTDPRGDQKAYALEIVEAAIRDKSILPLVRKLKNDKRDMVRRVAAKTEKQLVAVP